MFEVLRCVDMVEARGPFVHVNYFTVEADAVNAAKIYGIFGETKFVTIEIFESLPEFVEDNRQQTIKKALTKLSEEERNALRVG
jgi:hypothetical protein